MPAWGKALLQLLPLIAAGLQEAIQYIHTISDSSAATPSSWAHVQMVGGPVGSTERADDFVTTMDIVNITGGDVDSSWTQADYTAVHSVISSLMGAWSNNMSSGVTWREARYYKRSFNPLSNPKPFVKSGPPQAVFPYASVGAVSGHQAPQVAMTTTDRTPYPRHWGRNYWPHPAGGLTTADGYILTSTVDAWANTLHSAYAQLMGAEFFPVVVVTQVDKVPTRGLLTVSEVQVDNVWDVVRRRRNKLTTHRVRLGV